MIEIDFARESAMCGVQKRMPTDWERREGRLEHWVSLLQKSSPSAEEGKRKCVCVMTFWHMTPKKRGRGGNPWNSEFSMGFPTLSILQRKSEKICTIECIWKAHSQVHKKEKGSTYTLPYIFANACTAWRREGRSLHVVGPSCKKKYRPAPPPPPFARRSLLLPLLFHAGAGAVIASVEYESVAKERGYQTHQRCVSALYSHPRAYISPGEHVVKTEGIEREGQKRVFLCFSDIDCCAVCSLW